MIGGMFTSTLRDIDHDYLDHINKSATTGGVDFRHYLLNKSFYIDFKALVSQVQGSTDSHYITAEGVVTILSATGCPAS